MPVLSADDSTPSWTVVTQEGRAPASSKQQKCLTWIPCVSPGLGGRETKPKDFVRITDIIKVT